MLDALWTFLSNPANQGTLTWIGGGIVVAAGGVWTVMKSKKDKPNDGAAKVGVNADNGGVAMSNSTVGGSVTTNNHGDRKP